MAISGKYPQMTRFWLACRNGWRERDDWRGTSVGGGSEPPIPILQIEPGVPENGQNDFVSDKLADGRAFRILTVVDQFTTQPRFLNPRSCTLCCQSSTVNRRNLLSGPRPRCYRHGCDRLPLAQQLLRSVPGHGESRHRLQPAHEGAPASPSSR